MSKLLTGFGRLEQTGQNAIITVLMTLININKSVFKLPPELPQQFSQQRKNTCSTGTECDVALIARPQQLLTSQYLVPVRQQHTCTMSYLVAQLNNHN